LHAKLGQSGPVAFNPDQYLFWDEFHLTRIAQHILGEAAAVAVGAGIEISALLEMDTHVVEFGVARTLHNANVTTNARPGDTRSAADSAGAAPLTSHSHHVEQLFEATSAQGQRWMKPALKPLSFGLDDISMTDVSFGVEM